MSAKQDKTIAEIVSYLRGWADRLPQDPDDNFWFERPCEQMQEILRGLADDIEVAGEKEYDRGFMLGKMEAQQKELNFWNRLMKEGNA